MRITLVHPAGFNFVPGQPDFSVLANRMPPIGIMQLASWLEKFGHSVQLHDCLGPFAPRGIEANAEIVLATAPELVGFSATTSGFMDAVDMALTIKTRRPDIRIAFGNVHVSSLGAPILEHFPEIDYLVMGEGEGAMLDLADGRPLNEIGNLIYRDHRGKICINPRRDRIKDLDELPFPAYEKLAGFPHAYHLPLFAYEKRYGATMITSRGCPYTCSFCDRTVFERLYKTNSSQYTYDHMKYLRDRFGVHHINMYDDLFTAKRQRVMDLCDLLIEKPLGVQFNCAIRTGHTSDEMLRKLKQAGALMVSMGIESADPGMMERHKAGVTLDAVRETVHQIHAAGLRAKGLFIFGMPGETPETIRTTSDFILSLELDEMNMTKFSPLHGAPIWDECASGLSGDLVEDWRLMNCLNFVFLPKGFKSREEMDAMYNWHVKRFYDSRGYRRRFARRLWQHRWSLWHVARHVPETIAAARYFSANKEQIEKVKREFKLHPRQPVGLKPQLSPELQVDNIVSMSPIKLSRREVTKSIHPVAAEGGICCASAPEASRLPWQEKTMRVEPMQQQDQATERRQCDVLVIGGGPAGTTVAPLLAEKGYHVVLLEKARHPRFHIGESLLPANLPLFERLGVASEVKAIGMEKWAAEFVSPHHDRAQVFHFADAWDKSMPYAYQVKRAEFDDILIRNAGKKGVEVHQGCRVKAVDFLPDDSAAIRASHDDGRETEWQARFVVDASGRDTFLANRFQIKHRNPKHNSSAVYGHFARAVRHEGQAEGNITIFWFEHGWFWFIPMMNDTTSIGMVTWPYYMKTKGSCSLQQFLMDGIAMCPALAMRLKDAHLTTEVEATGNFSYVSERNHGPNYLLLGDAYAFIDPVFSSGVLLAMNSGVIGAEAIDTCLKNPAAAPAALRRFDALMKHGPEQFSWFIYRVTNPIMRDFFMGPKNIFRVKEALLSVLAGDIFGKTPIWRSVWVFKFLYYFANFIQPKRAFMGWKSRRFNIRKVDDPALYNA